MLAYKIVIEVEDSVKFNEVVFVPPVEEEVKALVITGKTYSTGKAGMISARTVNLPKINLPLRTVITEEEILPQKFAEKIDIIEKAGENVGADFGNDMSVLDKGFGKKVKSGIGISPLGKDGVRLTGREFRASGTMPGLSYKIDWEGGINRVKVSGELPRFPEGVKESATVKFRVVVLSDGTIERIFPLEKANPEFERSVLEALRSWRFNAIDKDVKQSGIITFNFQIK